MSTIYIVRGQTGIYDDHYEWNVMAFTDKQQAQFRVSILHTILKEHNALYENGIDCAAYNDKDVKALLESEIKNFDPHFSLDYTGTEYQIEELELV